MNEAWGNLVNAQVTYGTVLRNRPSEFEVESGNGYMARLEEYEKLLFPKMFFNSIGGIIKQSHCSNGKTIDLLTLREQTVSTN